MNHEDQILSALLPDCGRVVGDIIQSTGISFGHNRRTTSAFIAQKLFEMEKRGLVHRLDGEKPIAWVRGPKPNTSTA